MKEIRCINTELLAGKDNKPPLELGKVYPLLEEYLCKCGQNHYHVGLESKLNFVSCQKCNEVLPNSDLGGKHWCFPARFVEA